MLYLLTGEIRLGKTRWLEARLAELEDAGVEVRGVLSPGVWVPAEDGGFEKTGIDLVFLPEHRRERFAVHMSTLPVTDVDEDGYDDMDEESEPQAMSAEGKPLGWLFYPYFFHEVNGLFAEMRADREPAGSAQRLVAIDEIGRLELAGQGFSEALAFLTDGENPAWPDVVAIVRADLLERVRGLLQSAWGNRLQVIGPDDAGRDALISHFARGKFHIVQ